MSTGEFFCSYFEQLFWQRCCLEIRVKLQSVNKLQTEFQRNLPLKMNVKKKQQKSETELQRIKSLYSLLTCVCPVVLPKYNFLTQIRPIYIHIYMHIFIYIYMKPGLMDSSCCLFPSVLLTSCIVLAQYFSGTLPPGCQYWNWSKTTGSIQILLLSVCVCRASFRVIAAVITGNITVIVL